MGVEEPARRLERRFLSLTGRLAATVSGSFPDAVGAEFRAAPSRATPTNSAETLPRRAESSDGNVFVAYPAPDFFPATLSSGTMDRPLNMHETPSETTLANAA